MYSRTLAPLRSLARSSCRAKVLVAPSRDLRRTPLAFASRAYSSPPDAAPSESSSDGASETGKAAEADAEKKIASLEGRVKELEKDILYHRAELQTLNRRVIDERTKASEFAITSFARSLLSTSDVLLTALSHVPKSALSSSDPSPAAKALSDLMGGLELTHKALLKTFEQHGVKKMELSRGDEFDPNLHDATFMVPKEVAGEKEGGNPFGPGEVVEVGKEGWMIGSRVLRPAQVGVTQME